MSNLIPTAIGMVQSLLLALVSLIVGLTAIRWASSKLELLFRRSKLDETLVPFLTSLASASLKVLLLISIISILGIDTTSLVAVIAAAGFAVGLAFQGSLSNFAGGILLLTLRPFKVGDYIEAEGYDGTVECIKVLYTEIVTLDNKVIYLPNGNLSNSNITNYSIKDTRRLSLNFGVGYESDADRVISILRDIVTNHPLTLSDPEPFIRMSEHGDSALVFTVRAWTKSEDLWTVHFDLIEQVKKRFDEEGISIPFPQMDIHMEK